MRRCTYTSLVDPGWGLGRGRQSLRWERQPIILAIFPWKLYKNEKKKKNRAGVGVRIQQCTYMSHVTVGFSINSTQTKYDPSLGNKYNSFLQWHAILTIVVRSKHRNINFRSSMQNTQSKLKFYKHRNERLDIWVYWFLSCNYHSYFPVTKSN